MKSNSWPATDTSLLRVRTFEANVGTFYPCVARPKNLNVNPVVISVPASEAEERPAKTQWRRTQLVAKDLENCFDVVSPEPQNSAAYGVAFEKTINFCCTGVEGLFRKVLNANGKGESASMSAFVKLKHVLRLDEYSVVMVHYGEFEAFRPFLGWSESEPSQSLPWFNAYNELKHHFGMGIVGATLINAVSSAAAYYILAYAVYGTRLFPGYLNDAFFFQFADQPTWAPQDLYYESKDKPWQPVPLKL